MDRRGVHWIVEGYERVVEVLGPVGSAADSVVSWLLGLLGSFDTLVGVPLAWLTVGAVVYGRELGAPDADLGRVRQRVVRTLEEELEDERVRARLAQVRQQAEEARRQAELARRRASVIPEWLRSWVAGPITSVTGRFAALGKGLLTLVRAGLVPMVTLCLVLVAGRHAGTLVSDLGRWAVGPMDTEWAIVISPTIDVGLTLVNTVIMVVLIAAAVDRFLVRAAKEVRADEA